MKHINNNLKERIYDIIFKTDTTAGKAFDIVLIIAIFSNSILIILESVNNFKNNYAQLFSILGWIYLVMFTIEYLLRILVVRRKLGYIFSFFGIVDLLAILPIFISLFIPQAGFLRVIRIFRLLRLFSILKMGRYIEESSHLLYALKASRPKIIVFLSTSLFIIIMVGAMMYIIEGPENGFRNIPESMYWAIVTVSTVGYGDISPQTAAGKMFSSILMITSYGVLAVPTGIISHELATAAKNVGGIKNCAKCILKYYRIDDKYCSKCGMLLEVLDEDLLNEE